MALRDAYRHLNGSFYSRLMKSGMKLYSEVFVGSRPPEVANKGLAWDSVPKKSNVILLMTGIVGGGISNVNVIPCSPFAHYF